MLRRHRRCGAEAPALAPRQTDRRRGSGQWRLRTDRPGRRSRVSRRDREVNPTRAAQASEARSNLSPERPAGGQEIPRRKPTEKPRARSSAPRSAHASTATGSPRAPAVPPSPGPAPGLCRWWRGAWCARSTARSSAVLGPPSNRLIMWSSDPSRRPMCDHGAGAARKSVGRRSRAGDEQYRHFLPASRILLRGIHERCGRNSRAGSAITVPDPGSPAPVLHLRRSDRMAA
jgi:hypothetical protein